MSDIVKLIRFKNLPELKDVKREKVVGSVGIGLPHTMPGPAEKAQTFGQFLIWPTNEANLYGWDENGVSLPNLGNCADNPVLRITADESGWLVDPVPNRDQGEFAWRSPDGATVSWGLHVIQNENCNGGLEGDIFINGALVHTSTLRVLGAFIDGTNLFYFTAERYRVVDLTTNTITTNVFLQSDIRAAGIINAHSIAIAASGYRVCLTIGDKIWTGVFTTTQAVFQIEEESDVVSSTYTEQPAVGNTNGRVTYRVTHRRWLKGEYDGDTLKLLCVDATDDFDAELGSFENIPGYVTPDSSESGNALVYLITDPNDSSVVYYGRANYYTQGSPQKMQWTRSIEFQVKTGTTIEAIGRSLEVSRQRYLSPSYESVPAEVLGSYLEYYVNGTLIPDMSGPCVSTDCETAYAASETLKAYCCQEATLTGEPTYETIERTFKIPVHGCSPVRGVWTVFHLQDLTISEANDANNRVQGISELLPEGNVWIYTNGLNTRLATNDLGFERSNQNTNRQSRAIFGEAAAATQIKSYIDGLIITDIADIQMSAIMVWEETSIVWSARYRDTANHGYANFITGGNLDTLIGQTEYTLAGHVNYGCTLGI